jgi:sugar/nucleoside kinase (ribokinase family)
MITLQPVYKGGLNYNHIIGTGGIGSGMVFSIIGEHTLGRNESRLAELEPFKDYCKQHIVMHYVAVLMGAAIKGEFQSFPIGKVGKDEVGLRLVEKMRDAGMDTSYISVSAENSTLFGVCFQYPDYSGGNITMANSASSRVHPQDINKFFADYHLDGKKGVVLAVPEVPVVTRIELLQRGKKSGNLTVAAVASAEVQEFSEREGFSYTDILAINIDEAQHISGHKGDQAEPDRIARKCMEQLSGQNPDITILITNGEEGSYCLSQDLMEFTPALKTSVVSTAGAGDAFLAGVISGICCGLKLFKGFSVRALNEAPLQTAVDLGTLLASLSVTSADTIHEDADTRRLYEYVTENNLQMSDEFGRMFPDAIQ